MDDGILYLSGADVVRSMPPIAERLALAERALTALVADAEMPPKIGVHPRPEGSFAHAMPASLRPADAEEGAGDLLGIKWVTGFPANRELGLAPIHALVVVNDPLTGRPTAILDGGPITADRTAAVSGVAVRHWAPQVDGRAPRATVVGAGVQGRSHVEMLGHVLPGVAITIHDRHPERAVTLAEEAATMPGVGMARGAAAGVTAQEAVRDADVVITAVTFARPQDRQPMTPDWLAPNALLVAVDYAAMCSAAVARDAALFATDDRGQFVANRDTGQFDGFPDPTATIGEAILAGTQRPAVGRVVAVPLGIGLADVVFAAAIVERARVAGLGTLLAR
ncbi:MAG: NAD(P)-binding domain-containing protein [Candidatus Limnocylindrales bacterium]